MTGIRNTAEPITTSELQRMAIELGISALGVSSAEPYVDTEEHIAARSAEGLFADLKFTMSRPELSCHPERAVPQAKSVISAAMCYWRPDEVEVSNEARGRIARYTRWDAYAALSHRLEDLAEKLRSFGHEARVMVDHNEHVDREGAARSGIGFYGKHTNIISQMHGSWIVIGTIVTSAELESTEAMRPGCGSCTRCIDACPTDAIGANGTLNVNACITYWTQSKHSIPLDIRDAMADMVYGCDICQDVCPWNRGVEKRSRNEEAVVGSVSLSEWLTAQATDLNAQYGRFFIPRRDVRFLRRNALVAIGNRRNCDDIPLLTPFLKSDDEMLRDHAEWALQQITQAP